MLIPRWCPWCRPHRCCAPRSALTVYTDPGPHSGGNKQARRLCQWPEGCAVYARAQGLCTHHAKQQLPQSQRRKFHAILAVQSRAAKRLRSDPDMQRGCPVPAASSKSVAIEDNAYARTPTLAFGQMSQRCAHCRALYLAPAAKYHWQVYIVLQEWQSR